jgi:hypothetical protein
MSHASSAAESRPSRAGRQGPTRAVLAAVTLGVLLASTRTAGAQAAHPAPSPRTGWEILASSGALVPTGAQRDALKDAPLSTAQLSYVVRSRFAVTTTVGWARSRDLASAGDPKLSVFTYDVGAEVRAPRWLDGGALAFTPFAGVGAGGRSYNHRGLDIDATHNLAGYAAVGGELGTGRVHLRLEARDYLTGFRPLVGGGEAATRNDVVAMVGLRITGRRD